LPPPDNELPDQYGGLAEEEQNQLDSESQPNVLNPLTLGVIACLVAIPIISLSVLKLKHKNGNDKQI
jgi:hypothetical protein